MMAYDLLIKNGSVVLRDEVTKLDLAIKEGRIVALGEAIDGEAQQVIDAEGKTVFPGMIDIHVHFDDPGRTQWEGFETGSAMLAAGGCTAFFDMPLNGIPSTVTKQAFEDKVALGEAKSCIDFALWGGLVPDHLDDLQDLFDCGAIGFKAFLSPSGNAEFKSVDDLSLLAGMRKIAEFGGILALHSESAPMVTFLQQGKLNQGRTGFDDYAESRPPLAEVEAVSRALLFAELTGCALHFVHISTVGAVQRIQAAKKAGLNVTLETCPHYLLYNHDDFKKRGVVGKCAPPLRSEAERIGLTDRLLQGQIDLISSDHSPCEWKDKDKENLFEAWGGISGGQFSLLSAIEIALDHEISLTKVAEWTARHPAERFGLSACKGAIAIGKDADLAIVDLNQTERVTRERLLQRNAFSLYEGRIFPAKVLTTINRGTVVYSEGKINSSARGRWISAKA